MGIDHRRDGVGCVVETVYELEGECDKKGYAQEQEGKIGRNRNAGFHYVGVNAVDGEKQSARQQQDENDRGCRAGIRIEIRLRRRVP